jgi:hypothetical protein
MTTYWHIAHESYADGMALVPRDCQDYDGIETPWKWDDAPEGFDSGVVCLFADTPEGREEADWLWSDYPGYVLLRVEIDENCYIMRQVEEGYPAVEGRIQGASITVLRRGYADGVIGRTSVSA